MTSQTVKNMNEEQKEKIKFNIFPIAGLLFLPIAAPIMWMSDKIYFRERVNFEDAVEAFWIYVLLCLFWGGCVFGLWQLIEACMVTPLIVLLIAFIIFVVVGIPYLFCIGINGVINYKNKKSEKVLDKTEEN